MIGDPQCPKCHGRGTIPVEVRDHFGPKSAVAPCECAPRAMAPVVLGDLYTKDIDYHSPLTAHLSQDLWLVGRFEQWQPQIAGAALALHFQNLTSTFAHYHTFQLWVRDEQEPPETMASDLLILQCGAGEGDTPKGLRVYGALVQQHIEQRRCYRKPTWVVAPYTQAQVAVRYGEACLTLFKTLTPLIYTAHQPTVTPLPASREVADDWAENSEVADDCAANSDDHFDLC